MIASYYLESLENFTTLLARSAVFVGAVIGVWVALTQVKLTSTSVKIVVPLAVTFLIAEIGMVLYLIASSAVSVQGYFRAVTNIAIAGSFLCFSWLIHHLSGVIRAEEETQEEAKLREIQERLNQIHSLPLPPELP